MRLGLQVAYKYWSMKQALEAHIADALIVLGIKLYPQIANFSPNNVGSNPSNDTCVLERDICFNCSSSPRGKWVHVRAVMVLVIDLD